MPDSASHQRVVRQAAATAPTTPQSNANALATPILAVHSSHRQRPDQGDVRRAQGPHEATTTQTARMTTTIDTTAAMTDAAMTDAAMTTAQAVKAMIAAWNTADATVTHSTAVTD